MLFYLADTTPRLRFALFGFYFPYTTPRLPFALFGTGCGISEPGPNFWSLARKLKRLILSLNTLSFEVHILVQYNNLQKKDKYDCIKAADCSTVQFLSPKRI
jgi:hypothetical protein